MSVRREIDNDYGVYFITFTCCNWLPLFQEADGYDAVYKWFNSLKQRGHQVVGYVIMPNHVHALLAFRNTQGESINKIIGNGKRFIAYDIVKKLKENDKENILNKLGSLVSIKEKFKGKLHQVFEPSFDWKECTTDKFMEQKLAYIHENPCRGKWRLANEPEEYLHSSSGYYATGVQGVYEVLNYMELGDIDLTIPKLE